LSHDLNDTPIQLTPKRSVSKVLSDQTFDAIDRPITPPRRFSSSDIDQQSVHLIDMQNRQLIEQQKKRRIYHFNHTLFTNIYKRTHRTSSTDSHIYKNPVPTRERSNTRRRNHSVKEADPTNEHTTSDSVYIRALEKTIANPPEENRTYRTTLSVPDGGGIRRISAGVSTHPRLSESGNTSDFQVENGHAPQKTLKFNVEANNRPKKLSFLSARRRASYYPAVATNILSEDQKRKRDVIWPLKRSYSFDTPFHREAIDALNKGMFESLIQEKGSIIVYRKTNSFAEQDYSPYETCK
jgi:hypothetical protein